MSEQASPVFPSKGHYLVGSRRAARVGETPLDDLVEIWQRVTSRVVKYGFKIAYEDLEPPRTGIFDGHRIVMDPDVGFEMQCFVLLHLFGHSVQWVAPSLEAKLAAITDTKDKGRFMEALKAYEFEAARFGLQLLREADVDGIDQWYSDFVHTDWRYVERYYETGSIPPWTSCVVTGAAPIKPLAIPPLKHRAVEVRFAF
ncbi:MAG: hypothetical protein HY078_11745 [Elusimicrobia bacterium]|nr:hypothetical protein [Elusimicrobiota bacterium]